MPNLTKLIFVPPTGSPVDWTNYFIEMSVINRRIESDKPGEAGAIMFDTVTIEMPVSKTGSYFSESTLFGGSSKPKYHVKIIKHFDIPSADYQLFEGLIDLDSLKFTRHGTVQFDCYDKLSALKFYPTTAAREIKEAIAENAPANTNYLTITYGNQGDEQFICVAYKIGQTEPLYFTEPIVPLGSIIFHPRYYLPSTQWYSKEELFFVKQTVIYHDDEYCSLRTSTKPDTNNVNSVDKQFYYDYRIYGYDIRIIESGVLTGIDALLMLEAIIKSAYPSITVVNRTGDTTFPISLGFFEQTVNMPFDRPILEAIKYLAASMRVYVYIDRSGQFIIDKWPGFGSEPSTKPDLSEFQTEDDYRFTWDKLVDKVTIETVAADGSKSEAVAGAGYKNPVNTLERTVFASDQTAQQIANAYFDFYGKRHRARSITRKLDATVAQLDLTDWIDLGDKDFRDDTPLYYFIEKMSIDTNNDTVDLDLVSVKTFQL